MGDIEFEIIKTAVEAKPRKLSARWTIEKIETPRHPDLSNEEIQQKIEETYDRWCWETGSEADKELLEEFEKERDGRANMSFGLHVEEELMAAIAEEISNEIDKEILGKLKETAK